MNCPFCQKEMIYTKDYNGVNYSHYDCIDNTHDAALYEDGDFWLDVYHQGEIGKNIITDKGYYIKINNKIIESSINFSFENCYQILQKYLNLKLYL